MAEQRLCSIPGCGKRHKGRGYCGTHLLRLRRHGDPLYVVPISERDYSHNGRPKKHFVDPGWLRREYHEKRRPVGEIAAEIGCADTTLNRLVDEFGIPRRDGRAGCRRPNRRVNFDLDRAVWLYEVQRMNSADIGAELGCDGTVVLRRLREAGIHIRHHNDTKRGARSPRRVKLDARKVVANYLVRGEGAESTARKFGVSARAILRLLDEAGVPRKPMSEIRIWRGEDHPSWKPEITAWERLHRRDMARQAEWRVLVYDRDGYCCQRCHDDKGGNLHAHHIVAHNENRALRWELSNGITLCAPCHRDFHRRFGMRGFGRAELDVFLAS